MSNTKQRASYGKGYKLGFIRGFDKGKIEGRRAMLPFHAFVKAGPASREANLYDKTINAFIAAKNEEQNIAQVIKNAIAAGANQVIVVANGCTDQTAHIARQAGAVVMEYKDALGYDVGRALGLTLYTADINLVLDGDIVVSPEDLRPFINAVAAGVDVALNNLGPMFLRYARLDDISIAKYHLNTILGRKDLGINTLTAVPHALSKRAVTTIGRRFLCVPPKAVAKAVLEGLNIQAVHVVDVFKPNPIRPDVHRSSEGDLVAQMILGDHLEAIAYYLKRTNLRGGFTDLHRKRGLLIEN